MRWALGAAIALLLGFAYLTAIRPAFALAYALALLFVLAWAWPRLALRGIHLERTLDAGRPTVGEGFAESFTISRSGGVPAPWIEVRDLGEVPGYSPGRVVSVGRQPVRWTVRGTHRRRGWITFGPTEVRAEEPFGLFERHVRFRERSQVLVYPRVRDIPDLLSPSAQNAGAAQRSGHWADYPPETGGVRDYVAGDTFARIHWPLTARHGRLMSRTFEQPLTADIWIVLDLAAAAHFGDGEDSTVEYAVSLAASISAQVHSRGRKVGLLANDRRGTMLEPHRAVRQEQAILEFLAIAEPDSPVDLATALSWDRLRRMPRRALAVITPDPSSAWLSRLQSFRGRNSTLIAFYIDASTFGGPSRTLALDMGADVDLYVVRRDDDFARLVRTRDAIRIA